MVPTDYHDFLLGAVSMGAALVGLLFVAISVNPGGVGEAGHLTMRLRAASAMSALLNALFVSLVALLPGGAIGGTAVALGISGTLTMVGMLFLVLRRRRDVRTVQFARMVLLVVGQGGVCVLQVVGGVRLLGDPGDLGAVQTQAILLIVFFAIGVLRAWEYVGAGSIGWRAAFDEARRGVGVRAGRDEQDEPTAADKDEPAGVGKGEPTGVGKQG
jgi:hypothetical protein